MLTKVNVASRLASFTEHWAPKVVAELNGQYVKVVKFQGAYVWHQHEKEDELFFVLKGSMNLELCDGVVTLDPGEFVVVPRGVEHRPVADKECEAMLFEPATTRSTGNVDHGYTIEADDLEHI